MGRNLCRALIVIIPILGAVIILPAAPPRTEVRPAAAVKLAGNSDTTLPATTQPIPDTNAQAKADRAIRDLFKDEYTQSSLADRQAFAHKLLQQGVETHDDFAMRFVLLNQAYDVAVAAGDGPTALRAIEELARSFPLNLAEKLSAMLDALNRSADSPAAIESILRTALAAAHTATERDDYELARKVVTRAQGIANRVGRSPLATRLQDRLKEIQEQQKEFEQFRKATAALAQKPADTDANLTAGRFTCFVKGSWEHGLPLLMASNDASIKHLAEKDLAKPLDAPSQYELANGWWEFAEKQSYLYSAQLQARASYWYRKAVPHLEAINLTTAQKHLQEADVTQMRLLMLEPGLDAELFSDKEFTRSAQRRVDTQINFDWGMGPPADGMPKDDFSIRWTGQMLVHTPGKYTLIVIANSGARLTIDEKQLVNSDKLSYKRSGEHRLVEFSEGLHTIRLEFWDGGGEAAMKLLWIVPGSKLDEPIPAAVFYH